MANAPEVNCRRCGGTGMHEMPPAYAKTYALLSHDFWQSTAEILRQSKHVNNTSLCNRLTWLKREGFVDSRVSDLNHRMLEWRLT